MAALAVENLSRCVPHWYPVILLSDGELGQLAAAGWSWQPVGRRVRPKTVGLVKLRTEIRVVHCPGSSSKNQLGPLLSNFLWPYCQLLPPEANICKDYYSLLEYGTSQQGSTLKLGFLKKLNLVGCNKYFSLLWYGIIYSCIKPYELRHWSWSHFVSIYSLFYVSCTVSKHWENCTVR